MDPLIPQSRAGLKHLEALAVVCDGSSPRIRTVPEEVPVALVYNGHSQAVMMATPADIEDFAVGFSLTEQIIESVGQVAAIEIGQVEKGIRVELGVPESVVTRLIEQSRRTLVGRTGCGLCGVDTLEQVEKKLDPVASGATIDFPRVRKALSALAVHQKLNADARALHAAAFCDRNGQLSLLREDVGRHNALDKLIGALARSHIAAGDGFCVITSRCSYEMVQKAAIAGFQILVAISAPTAPAVRIAGEVGMTLIALARDDGMLVFSRQERLDPRVVEEVSTDSHKLVRGRHE